MRKALGINGKVGLTVHKEVPPDLLEDVRVIANETQHGFLNTWLPDLIENGIRPVVRDTSDEARIDRILSYRDHAISLSGSGGVPCETEKRLDFLRKKFASAQLQFHMYENRTERAKDIFKVAVLASIGGFFLSQFAPAFVQSAEAIGDDVANWAAQIATMRDAGLGWKEIAKSQIFPAASLGGVQLLTNNMNAALQSGASSKALLGFQYGLAASLVSLAAVPSSLFLLAKHYLALVKEGKANLPQFQGKWKKVRVYIHALKQAAKQSWKYPAVPGIVLGSLASIAAGALLGPLAVPFAGGVLLQNPVFLAVSGAGPSVGALVSAAVHRRLWNRRFRKSVENLAAG